VSGIYPDWTGPTVEQQRSSIFPHWIQVLGGILPSIPEGWLGGVEVLPRKYGAAMVESVFGSVLSVARTTILQVTNRLGVTRGEKPGVEVTDEEAGL